MNLLLYHLGKISQLPEPVSVAAPTIKKAVEKSTTHEVNKAPIKAAKHNFKTYDDRERRTNRSDLSVEMQRIYDAVVSEYPIRRGYHEKMKMASTDEDRAKFRAKLLESQQRIEDGWARIDAWLEANPKSDFKESTCRSYISRALRAAKVSDATKAGVKARVKLLQQHGCVISDKTMADLKAKKLL